MCALLSVLSRLLRLTKASTVPASSKRRVELKRVADSSTITTVTSAGSVIPFPIPEAGDGSDERDGRMVEHRGYQAIWTYIPTNLLDYEKVRVLVVLWKGLPGIPSYRISSIPLVGQTSSGQYNVKTAANVEILRDQIYDVNTQGGLSAASTTMCRNTQAHMIRGTKRFQQGFKTQFADLTEGSGSALYFVIIPLVGGGASSIVMSSTFVDV